MSQPAKVQEPSMEEILASIRRIIADDEAKPDDSKAADSKAADPKALNPKGALAKATEIPAPAKPSMKDIPPSNLALTPGKPSPRQDVSPTRSAEPPPPKNDQDDIDALMAGFDAAPAESAPTAAVEDVLELTDEMALADAEPQGAFRKVEPQDDLEFTEPIVAAKPYVRPARREPQETAPPEQPVSSPSPQVMSQTTVTAVESAFNSLAATVLSNNARTLEDLVREMLRPLLKSWLDDNLPGLVERIVKAEIERVSRGR